MRTTRITVVTLAATLGLLLVASPALAYWIGGGTGSGAVSTGTLQPPTAVIAPARSDSVVSLSWTASSGSIVPTGYVVTRISGSSTSPACGSSPQNLITATTCVDSVPVDGNFTYGVTAVYRSWTAVSTASAPVVVARAAKLAFGANPSNAAAGVAVSPAVSVVVQSADGSAVQTAGVVVTLAFGANPSVATLSGTLTAPTDSNGVATFADLVVDAPGAGYTLVATSGSLPAATSAPFAITAAPLARVALGRATTYSALGSAVTNTGVSSLSGDLGAYPTVSATGFPDGTVQGETHTGDSTASGALADFNAAYSDAKSRPSTSTFSADRAGSTFLAGVHRTGAAFELSANGVVTLDAQGDPNAVFIFQVDAALNTAAGSSIKLVNGATASNVFWQVNGAAGTGANSLFSGTILANGAITIGADGQLIGRALSSGAITLAANTIRFTTELPPTVSITGGPSVVASSSAPTISGNSTAAAGQGVTVEVSGQSLMTTVRVDGSWSIAVSALAAGTYTVLVRVRDAAGNAATASQSMTVQ